MTPTPTDARIEAAVQWARKNGGQLITHAWEGDYVNWHVMATGMLAAADRVSAGNVEGWREALQTWKQSWQSVLDASAAHNARLELVRAERERGNWSMRLDVEHDACHAAERAEFQAKMDLFEALSLPATRPERTP